jgi:hypothetical protein
MMPQLMTVKVIGRRRRFRLWIPLLPVLIVLSPIMILAALVFAVLCLAMRINPFAALMRTGRLYTALRGLHIEVHEGPSRFLISVT